MSEVYLLRGKATAEDNGCKVRVEITPRIPSVEVRRKIGLRAQHVARGKFGAAATADPRDSSLFSYVELERLHSRNCRGRTSHEHHRALEIEGMQIVIGAMAFHGLRAQLEK